VTQRNPVLSTPVGQALDGVEVTRIDHDIELLIKFCLENSRLASADGKHDSAVWWTQRTTQSKQCRRREIVAAWDRWHLRMVDEGLAVFDGQQAQEVEN
jgi:hypothetical protein